MLCKGRKGKTTEKRQRGKRTRDFQSLDRLPVRSQQIGSVKSFVPEACQNGTGSQPCDGRARTGIRIVICTCVFSITYRIARSTGAHQRAGAAGPAGPGNSPPNKPCLAQTGWQPETCLTVVECANPRQALANHRPTRRDAVTQVMGTRGKRRPLWRSGEAC